VASELLVRMNQNMYYNTWVPLVVYEFSGQAGSGQVNLTDLTEESDKEIAFTAIRWRQVVTQTKVVQTDAGYDPPMGSAAERMSLKVWPGQWTDATGFAVRYSTVGDAYHTGADLNLPGDADRDTPVYAPAPGVVTFSGRSSGSWGQLVVIRHDALPDGTVMWSRLAHVSSRIVKEGDRVDRGQQVANIGNADGQLAYHLHFDLAKTSILETSPGHWPGLDLNVLMQNYVDPKAFVEAHRPAGRV
jgi:murein DD-endopeptidase MepM/ murein hydrolase activator NlpD